MQKKLSVYIGRFSPFHYGHASAINQILATSDKVLILIGSSNRSRSLKNPFSFEERRSIIENYLKDVPKSKFSIEPLEDNPYNDNEWIASVQKLISTFNSENYDVEIVSSDKEDLTSYPHWFPGYGKKILAAHQVANTITSATAVRNCYFYEDWAFFRQEFEHLLPVDTLNFLQKFYITGEYASLKKEFHFIKDYKKSWEAAPYPPIFVTVDAVVVQSGHIALIQRRDNPGKGLWALPGGFLNPDEKLKNACIRELREETGIHVPDKVLEGSIVDSHVFDSPSRSERGRTITHAFYIKLKDELKLPDIKGSDDAIKAKWVPISEVFQMRNQFYEDHFFIIKKFL